MANLGNIIKILKVDYNTIVAAYPNSATISTGATVTYDPNSLYLVDGESGVTDVQINGTSVVSGTIANLVLAAVATSGSYNDLSNKPTIPTIKLNNTSTTSPDFWAPTTYGTAGNVLKANGAYSAPSWSALNTGTHGTAFSSTVLSSTERKRYIKIGNILICYGYKYQIAAGTTISFGQTFDAIPFVLCAMNCTGDSLTQRSQVNSLTTTGFTLPSSTSATTLNYA